jgi:hypothetical protein
MSDRQCPSCGGICKKSGCERANIEGTPDEYLLNEARICIEELRSQLLHDGVPTDLEHPKRLALSFSEITAYSIVKRLGKL